MPSAEDFFASSRAGRDGEEHRGGVAERVIDALSGGGTHVRLRHRVHAVGQAPRGIQREIRQAPWLRRSTS